MQTKQPSTTQQLNNLVEFRQIVYEQILSKSHDTQMKLLDTL